MTVNEAQTAPATPAAEAPGEIEAGRYRVLDFHNGEWSLYRAVDLCESCSSCRCGTPLDRVDLPDFTRGQQHLMAWAVAHIKQLRQVLGG